MRKNVLACLLAEHVSTGGGTGGAGSEGVVVKRGRGAHCKKETMDTEEPQKHLEPRRQRTEGDGSARLPAMRRGAEEQ